MGFLKDNEQPSQMAPVADPMGWRPDENILASISGAPGQAEPMAQAKPRRERISTLDIIGSILDAGAEIGDSNPGYREAVARRTDRENAMRERDWQDQFNQQKLRSGTMGLEKGQMEIDAAKADQGLTRFGQASRGLGAVFAKHGPEGIKKAFPLLAKQLGMNAQETAIFGEALAADPQGTIAMIEAATAPNTSGSPPKEKIISDMLRARDPSGRMEAQYLDNLARGMSGYQEGQLSLGRDKLSSNERIAEIRARATANAARERARTTGVKTDKRGKPVIDPATLDLALGVTGELRGIYDDMRRGGAMVNPDQTAAQNIMSRVRSSGFGQLVEGALGTDAQTNRDMIAGIRPNLIRRISEATGMTAAQMNSDKDMQLLLDQVTDPTMSFDANMAAIDRLEELIVSRSGNAPAARTGGGGSRPRIRIKPRGTPAAPKRMVYDPKTGEIR
jgi:hypothetical protein